ncbi:MAG TPA: imidazoleglycerol-phosphate dehydratase HisB [Gemmatimonadaceae bacterium]|nr:imidazoleglycerol-phosphate dehydratase HisB [Gemmatimonadaceae bacterium]
MSALTISPAVAATSVYAPVLPATACDLDLAGGGSDGVDDAVVAQLFSTARACIGRYPDSRELTARIAARFDVAQDRVLVTAGADEALERACRVALGAGRNAIVTEPTFEMLHRYVALAGGACRRVAWPGGAFPVDDVLATADRATTLVAIVSPNNPTGLVATLADVRRIHDALPSSLILLDLAYVEYADTDITRDALQLPRVLVTRTLSKAWGLPGLRVGYALGCAEVVGWMRAAGGPYSVSSLSLAVAERALDLGEASRAATIDRVRTNRGRLTALLRALGETPPDSQANFVCVAGQRARWLRDALAANGIATRLLANDEYLRITVPAADRDFARLSDAIEGAFRGNAIAPAAEPPAKAARVARRTRETDVRVDLSLHGAGRSSIATGIGFLDHMLAALTLHARFDLTLACRGDLEVDDHHTAEDCALAIGGAIDRALGDRSGIARFGYAYAPLDEALARAVVDCSGRPFAHVQLGLVRDRLGALSCENVSHFFSSLAAAARVALHVDVLRGDNDHHRAEAAFKAVALALRAAAARLDNAGVPSTKGVLT